VLWVTRVIRAKRNPVLDQAATGQRRDDRPDMYDHPARNLMSGERLDLASKERGRQTEGWMCLAMSSSEKMDRVHVVRWR